MDPSGLSAVIGKEVGKTFGKLLFARVAGPGLTPGSRLATQQVDLHGRIPRSREAERLSDGQVAKLVRELLHNVVDQRPELRALPDGDDVQALLVDSLNDAENVGRDNIYRSDLSVDDLVRSFRKAAPGHRYDGLSAQGRDLYDGIILACAENIFDHYSREPEFATTLQIRTKFDVGRMAGNFDQFANRYVDYVDPQLDQQQMFGLRLPQEIQTYQLSAAYVSLSLEWLNQSGSPLKRSHRNASQAARAVDRLELEDVLSDRRRLIIDGPAGSGKTTLLKRLALHSTRNEFPEKLHDWNGLVPFFLPVRRFVEAEPPQPDGFLRATAPTLIEEAPVRWASTLLREGRALVLVDGVDEVPLERRTIVVEWLTALSRAYPASRFVVSSRPGALEDQRIRLQNADFVAARIDPMSGKQVRDFVDLWHSAHPTSGQPSEEGAASLGAQLISAIESRRDLARLATTPLLCSMLCALNVSSNSWLPRERSRLYRDALEMLLERREKEQKIQATEVRLDAQHLEAVLARLAFWMLLNGRRTITNDYALLQIGDLVPRIRGFGSSFRTDDLDPSDVLDHLVARSGLLQRSTDDHLEFRHPSFQDYLSASEVFRQEQAEHLVNQAHDPLYHDVVIMAVCQAQSEPARQSAFLRSLISRARNEPSNSRLLWLLTAAAIEDAGLVDPDIGTEVAAATRQYLPPQDFDQAFEISEVGPFCLDLLSDVISDREHQGLALSPKEAAATVRTVSMIDSAGSLHLLRRLSAYSKDSPLVQSDLLLGWRNSVDQESFAEDILQDLDFGAASFHAGQPSDLELFRTVHSLRTLSVGEWCESSHLTGIAGLQRVEELQLSRSQVNDLEFLSRWPFLRILTADRTAITNLQPLSNCPELTAASFSSCPIDETRPLAQLNNLSFCSLADTRVSSLDPLWSLTGLKELDITRTEVRSLDGIGDLSDLNQLSVSGTFIDDLSPLVANRSLETLQFSSTSVSKIDALRDMSKLRRLEGRMTDVRNLDPLTGCTELIDLDVSTSLCQSISVLGDLPNLRRIDLSSTRITNVIALSRCSPLQQVNLCGLPLDSIAPLVELPNLQQVCLDDRHRLCDGFRELQRRPEVRVTGPAEW